MGFHPSKARLPSQFCLFILSGPRGALHFRGAFWQQNLFHHDRQRKNSLWSRCLRESLIALEFGKAYFDPWRVGDYDGYLEVTKADAAKDDSEAVVKSRATLWFNRGNDLTRSEGDLWLDKDRDSHNLYWAQTTSVDPVFDHSAPDSVMLARPVTKWSRHDKKMKPLSWKTIPSRREGLYLLNGSHVQRRQCRDESLCTGSHICMGRTVAIAICSFSGPD
ncbi:hypothetical protein [Mesorhizobium sp. M0323]|uniref:hypothetical protein n=1 Tax=Mesorhizobium sp. M0323 TaxID=2956938 RepID=UPI0033390DC3